MPRIGGVNVTQYDNLNIENGLLYVNGVFLNFERSGNFTARNITNLRNDLNITGNLYINGIQKTPTASGSIIAFADNLSGGTIVTASAPNYLADGVSITISGTTNYNGTFNIFNTTVITFDIPVAFAGDDATGTWTIDTVTFNQQNKATQLSNVNMLGELGLDGTLYLFP